MPKKLKEIPTNQELLRKLLVVLRDYAQVLAEKQSLIAILKTAVLANQPPVGWEDQFEASPGNFNLPKVC
jgi:hypothetical protein